MKKTTKVGLMAGLLITPAIVAQAGEVQASESVTQIASLSTIDAEKIYLNIKNLTEVPLSATSTTITSMVNQYNSYFDIIDTLSEEIAILNNLHPGAYEAMKAKIDYLLAYSELIEEAKRINTEITNLTATSSNLINSTTAIQTKINNLDVEYKSIYNNLASAVGANTDLLSNLTVFNGGELQFVLTNLTAQVKLDELLANSMSYSTFIENNMEPIRDAKAKEPFDAAAYKTAVADARANFNALSTTLKSGVKVQLFEGNINVETYLKNEEANITKANTLDVAIDSFVQNIPSSSTTFISTLTKHKNAYAALDEFTKKLVVNSAQLAAYTDEFIDLIKGIDGLAALATNSSDLRTKVTQYRLTYNSLSAGLKMDVKNLEKLTTLEALIETVKKVESEIQKILTDQSQPTVTNAILAYGNLTFTEKKYVLKDSVDMMQKWEKMFGDANKLISQIETIDIQRFNKTLFGSINVMKTDTAYFISTVDKVNQAYEVYKTNYVTQEFDAKTLITNNVLLENYKLLSNTAKPVMALSVNSKLESFDTEKENVEKLLVITDVPSEYGSAINVLRLYIDTIKKEKESASKVQDLITGLETSIDIAKLVSARELYNQLSTEAKAAVANAGTLTTLEKQYKAAINVVNSIEQLAPTAKDFTSKTISAKAAYDSLTSTLKPTVTNYKTLEALLPIAQLMQDINKIKATSTTFRTDLENANTKFAELTTGVTIPSTPDEGSTPVTPVPVDKITLAKQELLVVYGKKLAEFKAVIGAADDVMTKINNLGLLTGKEFMDQLSALAEQYKKLDSVIKKSVTNAKILTDLEKDYKNALKVFNLIENLPANTDKTYAKKVVAAEKAYQALAAKPKEYVYNYEKLRKVLKVANIIERIDKLKIGSKTFESEIAQIRAEYDILTPEEKAIVYNASKLVEAEENQSSAEKVIALINEAIPTAEGYIEKLTAARTAFNALDRSQQKLVTNEKDLTTRERAVKPVLTLDEDILKLDPSNAKTFLSKFKNAERAYEKLSITDRTLLLNIEKFTGELMTIHQVIFAINAVKPSSKTFVADVKAARTLYEALTPEHKEKISNLSVLENHELNVLGGEKIDAMIRELSSAAPNEFITKVKEARAAFKALSSANKKAVTLEAELKAQEKYIQPVEKVITEIEGLSNPKNDLSRQFIKVNTSLQKLDDVQRSYITNMDKYSNLSNVTYVYQLIEKLKLNDRYFQGNLEAAKTAYDKLSQDEKLKVTNYYKLQEAQVDVAEAQNMMSIIASLSRTSSSYFADIERALAAYKAIPSALKKQVTNYDVLKQAEKDMKAVQKVMKQIEELDPTARTYESRAKSALKAYEKLSADQKELVTNYSQLQSAVFELGL